MRISMGSRRGALRMTVTSAPGDDAHVEEALTNRALPPQAFDAATDAGRDVVEVPFDPDDFLGAAATVAMPTPQSETTAFPTGHYSSFSFLRWSTPPGRGAFDRMGRSSILLKRG